jgi:trk system potassium uptake protein TrkH
MAAIGFMDAANGVADWSDLPAAAGLVLTLGGLVALATYAPPPPTARFGFLLVVSLWFTAPLAGAAPFLVHGLSLTDAVFESVSGLTTTGSTVMVGLDAETRGILLWRSLLQWIGGIGILALGLVLLPYLRIGGMQLFSKESSDRSDKPLPRFASFGRTLLAIYVLATVLCALAYSAVGMSAFDAVNHAMTTLSTGGYSTYDASMGHFEGVGPLWVGSLFMMVGALPFSLYVAALVGRRAVTLDPQVRVLIAIVAAASLSLMIAREGGFESRAAAEAVFNVISVITTTGFAASDYGTWGPYAVALFFLLTFLGGCAGSTSGAIKTYRLIVVAALLRAHHGDGSCRPMPSP